MKAPDLRAELRKRGLDDTGMTEDLEKRLIDAIEKTEPEKAK